MCPSVITWEKRQLGELFKKNTEKNNQQFESSKTISIATMKFKEKGNGAAESSLDSYKVLRIGDIAFEGHKSNKFAFGRFVLNDIGNGIMSPRFTALRPIKEQPITFWKQYIHYEPIMRGVLVKSTKLGTMMNELVISDFEKQQVLIPSNKEQYHIGKFLERLDNLITVNQDRILILQKSSIFKLTL